MDVGMLLLHRVRPASRILQGTEPGRVARRSYGFESIRRRSKMSILRKATTTVFCLALMGVGFSPTANASEWNRKTTKKFFTARVGVFCGTHTLGGVGAG